MRTPQEIFDGLGLDNEGTPYRTAGGGSDGHVGGEVVDEMHVLRYDAGGSDAVVVLSDAGWLEVTR
jgi:hypothetical protein